MEWHSGPASAVVALDIHIYAGQVRRELFVGDLVVNHSEQSARPDNRLGTHRALVRVLRVNVIACLVNRVPAFHEDPRCGAIKQVFQTNGAVRVRRPLETPMIVLLGQAHAHSTGVAVESVDPNPLANAAYATVGTVEYTLLLVVAPQFTDRAVIAGYSLPALATELARLLWVLAQKTQHVLCLGARQLVVLLLVVTEATGEEAIAGNTMDLAVAYIVLAPQSALRIEARLEIALLELENSLFFLFLGLLLLLLGYEIRKQARSAVIPLGQPLPILGRVHGLGHGNTKLRTLAIPLQQAVLVMHHANVEHIRQRSLALLECVQSGQGNANLVEIITFRLAARFVLAPV